MQIPAGYALYNASTFSVTIGPVYRSTDSRMSLALRADHSHANTMGGVHGGLLLALADTALGNFVKSVVGPDSLAVTTDLHASFMLGAKVGQWIEVEPELDHRGRTMVFASAAIRADDRKIARVQGTFFIHRKREHSNGQGATT